MESNVTVRLDRCAVVQRNHECVEEKKKSNTYIYIYIYRRRRWIRQLASKSPEHIIYTQMPCSRLETDQAPITVM